MGGPAKTDIRLEIADGEGVCVVFGGPLGWSQWVEFWITW